ncbi:hypothetical protein DFH94DRAFT_361308 [Russula ochroleuca]|uniref:Uncharacterized protein n=1 Tax=Russula ochroleuca TaxID=152965 RepID=A0A9P5MKR6_9AGAM|nr:hypothetical protein DFH94DRAFT_361308 [Russula ochroleuca]
MADIATIHNSAVLLPLHIRPPLLTALSAPTTRLRYRILNFVVLFAECVGLVAISTVRREEQLSGCSVTFFSGSGAAEPPVVVRMLLIPAAALVLHGIRLVLAIFNPDNGIASLACPPLRPPSRTNRELCILALGNWNCSTAFGIYEYSEFVDP